jgi:Ca2+/Na+ antiporter
MEYRPSWRKPAGMFLILAVILFWAILIASFSEPIGRLPGIVQAIVYIVAGIIWIFPMRPVLVWMETGRWR